MATARAAQTPPARRRVAGHALARAGEPAVLLLIGAMLASAVVILAFTRNITFLLDEWEFLLYRRGFDAHVIFDPHNEHIVVGPILIYKALLGLFGMDSARPFQIASTAAFLASAALLFAWLRGRAGDWIALGATVLVLFCGAAWEDLLWSFQIGYFVAMASGLGMLLALRRGDRTGDRIACALLTLALAFSSLGLSFVVGALVAIALAPEWRRRLYIVVIPAALFAIWWLGWGHTAENHISLHNIAAAPLYVFDSIGAGISSLLGFATPRDESGVGALDWGHALAALAIVLAGIRIYRLGRVPTWLWVVGAIGLSYWLLAAANVTEGRGPDASRYQYPNAVFLVLIAAELLRGLRVTAGALAAGAAAIALAVISNVSFLHQSAESYERTSDLIKADLGAVDIARDTVSPDLVLAEDIAGTGYVGVPAGLYLSAADAFGSPADSEAEIAAAPEPAREAADRVLAAALGLAVAPEPATSGSGCRTVDASAGPQVLELQPGKTTVLAGSAGVALRLRRFATSSFPVDAGSVGADPISFTIPPDRSDVPWQLQVSGRAEATVCEQAPA